MKSDKNMMHGFHYYTHRNISGWLMSEKINGIRAYWDGAKLWTRGGHEISAPDIIIRNLPEGIELDGELNAGRTGGFEKAKRAVQQNIWDIECVFSAFDAPDLNKPFSDRYAFLQYILPSDGPVHYIVHCNCGSLNEAVQFMATIQAAGGEGVVLRSPVNRYHSGRTNEILKLKRMPDHVHHPLPALR